MKNSIFADKSKLHDEDHYNDHDDYHAPNTSTVDERKFIMPNTTDKETESTLRLGQKIKGDKYACRIAEALKCKR